MMGTKRNLTKIKQMVTPFIIAKDFAMLRKDVQRKKQQDELTSKRAQEKLALGKGDSETYKETGQKRRKTKVLILIKVR